MSKFAGKTIVITGASRGIGQAIGLRFAKEQANIVILAKEEVNDKSANIYAAADEMNAAGGRCLAIAVDVSDEQAVEAAINETLTQFGTIDALINNVSAFCFNNTIDISPENFDLLFSVNVRATFLLSKLCQPHLKKSNNPHILNIAPPLDMNARWFKNHLAFTMSKFGMSMCTLGMAEEFKKDGIAVNSLWPKTTIATSTIQEHFVPQVYSGSRWPSIMADAALIVMQRKAGKCTGNFFIDEDVLHDNGVSDFTIYAVDPSVPLTQDLFVPSQENCEWNTLERESFV